MKMSTDIRVLIVEDSESDALLLVHLLEREGYQPTFERVDTPEAMRTALAARPWNLILANDSLPSFSAPNALALVDELGLTLPFIVVSGASDEATAIPALSAGAHDFIVKGNWARLGPAIARELRVAAERRQRQRAEEALSASEERFRALVENSADAIILLDANGVVRSDTPAVTNRILGYSSNELVGQRALELVHPEDLENVSAVFDELIGSQDIQPAQFRIRHKDGTWRWMEAVGANLLDLSAVGAIVINARDISERKRVEAQLRANEEKFRVLIEKSSDAISLVDAQGKILFESPAATRMSGYALDDMVGHEVLHRIHPDDLEFTRTALVELTSQPGSSRTVVCRTHHKDGTWRWIEAVATNLLYVPAVQAIVINYRDITERKEAEDALRASEEKLRLIAERITEVFYLIDIRNNKTLYVSPGFERVWGMSRSGVEKNPQNYMKAIHPDDLQRVQEDLVAEQSGLPFDHEYRIIRPDGVMRWIWDRGYPVRSASGAVDRYVGVAQDITDRKHVEEGLRERERQLTALVTSLDDLVFEVDAQGTYRQVWTANESLLTIPKSQLLGKSLVDVWGDEIGALLRSAVQRVLASGKPETREFPLEIHERALWSMARANPIFVPGETPHSVVVLVRDITERKQVEEANRRQLTELAAVHQVSSALRVADTAEQALTILLDQILAALETEAGVIYLYDSIEAVLRAVVARGWPQDLADTPIKPGEGIVGTVSASGEAHVTLDFARDPLTHPLIRGRIPSGWAGACLPIRNTVGTIGVIFVCVPLPREISAEEMRLLESLAEMAGTALHRIRLHQLTEQRLQRLTALRAVDQAISASVDLRLTLGILVDQVLAQLRPDAVEVLLLDPRAGLLNYAAGRGFKTNLPEQARVRLGLPLAGQVALERRVMSESDFRSEERSAELTRLLAAEGFVAFTGVPLIAKGRVQGVLEVFHRAAFHPPADWLDFLEALAGQAAIAVDNALLFEELQQSNTQMALAYDATIEGWSRAMDLRDKETEGHTRRVAELTVQLARTLGISEEEIVPIRRGALLHDIGKMGVPDAILSKPGPLTDAEWAIMRKHPVLAHEMLAPIAYLGPALDIPFNHHEKWDGTGYPRGLRGEEIPLAARIFAVADVWDALRSDRPYRPAWPEAEVREHIRALSGTHFDPRVVTAFLQVGRLPE